MRAGVPCTCTSGCLLGPYVGLLPTSALHTARSGELAIYLPKEEGLINGVGSIRARVIKSLHYCRVVILVFLL